MSSDLEKWTTRLSTELGLPAGMTQAQIDVVLDLARDAAHGIARPAAPLTTYLMGVAVGRGADPDATAASITALIDP